MDLQEHTNNCQAAEQEKTPYKSYQGGANSSRSDLLWEAFLALKRQAAPGADGVTWEDYELRLEGNLKDLQARVQSGR
jgi:hypothetical protein